MVHSKALGHALDSTCLVVQGLRDGTPAIGHIGKVHETMCQVRVSAGKDFLHDGRRFHGVSRCRLLVCSGLGQVDQRPGQFSPMSVASPSVNLHGHGELRTGTLLIVAGQVNGP